ncbi:MAG: lytic murein transglycosylase B [Acidiferrobacterales bacterium]|nr:lytic murein transglycosylase B [Acidiferrobacterales bacterium]
MTNFVYVNKLSGRKLKPISFGVFLACVISAISLTYVVVPVHAVEIDRYPALVKLVDTMVKEDGYPRADLESVLADAKVQQKTIDLMNKQYEALPWYKYRDIFINQARIDKGVVFLRENRALLESAQQKYGVPPHVITALIGVETHYGTRMGNRRVLDSLVTLTADFPRRSKFFGSELRQFLKTTREENIAANSVMGSYAGAIGIPQFMPTSYEAYSVDFNNNGKRDLVNELEDAVGSVANYLAVHGWRQGQEIFASLSGNLPESAKSSVSKRAKPKLSANQLQQLGVKFNTNGASDKMALLSLSQKNGKRYFIGFRNFYAITRYNPSVNYAMAVTELSMQIEAKSRSAN